MTKSDNRSVGGRFEQTLSQILYENGFWVHVLQQNRSGQPADIIAVKGRYHTLIDCKVISEDKGFLLRRIEENQRLAMTLFVKRAGEGCWFALRLPDGSIRMMSLRWALEIEEGGGKSITEKEILGMTWPIEKWLYASDLWSKDV